MTGPIEVPRHAVENALVSIGNVRNPSMQTGRDDGIVQRMLDLRWTSALLLFLTQDVELLMEIVFEWDRGIDNVPVQKHAIVQAQQMRMNFQIADAPSKDMQAVQELRIRVMVAEDVVNLALGIDGYQITKPLHTLLGRLLMTGPTAPTKVKDIAT
jgi:hypothetical protein